MNHLLIIWSNASEYRDRIISDLKQHFLIRNAFKFHWEQNVFEANLKVFYAHSQKHLEDDAYHKLLVDKMAVCGTGEFYVVLFEDKAPRMEMRKTSSGKALVNVNVFDAKALYRKWTGGGHRIHTSNDEWETNKDLTVLFGLNTEDLFKTIPENSDSIAEYSSNCMGVGGFESIQQLFYLLNNTLDYCVLRNHEYIPDQFRTDRHGDIDLLVENKNYIKYLTQATDVFGLPYRVYHTIRISGQEIPFDFRYLGDGYYDKEWEKDILKTRKFSNKGFYIPNEENQFYSLLYHAYVQKPSVADDYFDKLSLYAEAAGISFNSDVNNAIGLLDDYFGIKNYDYIRPSDKSVYYNEHNLSFSRRIDSFGRLVSKNVQDEDAFVPFFSSVYAKKDAFVKRGSRFLIENELFFFLKLSGYDFFPPVLSFGVKDNIAFLETGGVPGKAFDSFFSKKGNNTPRMVHSFLTEIVKILRVLVENDILHRDFIPQNIIVKETGQTCKVSLIDFGWATSISKKNECLRPKGLADSYGLKNGYSDFYSLGKVIESQWGYWVPSFKRFFLYLESIVWEDYDDVEQLKSKIDRVDSLIGSSLSLMDRLGLFVYRHKSARQLWNILKKMGRTVSHCFNSLYKRIKKRLVSKKK